MTFRITAVNAQVGSALPRLVVPLPLGVGASAEPLLASFLTNNWQAKVRMKTTWGSDVARSYASDAQSRRQLNQRPTRTVTVELAGLNRKEAYLVQNIAQRHASSRVPAPLYSDAVCIDSVEAIPSSTMWLIHGNFVRKRFYVGQRVVINQAPSRRFASYDVFLGSVLYAIVRGVSYDSILVQDADFTPTATGNDLAAGNIVYPLIDCRMSLEHQGVSLTDRHNVYDITFREESGPMSLPGSWEGDPSALFPVAGGSIDFNYAPDAKPVYNPAIDWRDGVPKEFVRQGQESDSGKAGVVKATGFRPSPIWELPLSGDREFMWRQLNFFDWARGRSNSFWFIDFESPWDIRTDANGNSVGWGVSGLGTIAPQAVQIDKIDSLTSLRDFYTHVAIAFSSQPQPFAIRKITNVVNDPTSYRLEWADPLPNTLWALFTDQGEVRIYPCRLVNFGDDSFEESWETDDFSEASVVLTGVEEERDINITLHEPDEDPSPIPEDANFSFAAGDNNYTVLEDGTLVRAGAWPSFNHRPSYIFDSREELPHRMELQDAPRVALRNLTGADPAVFTYRQDRSNGQRPTLIDPSHLFLPHVDFGEDLTLDQSRVWGPNDWTLMVCIPPSMRLNDYVNPTMVIRDGGGDALFEWWWALGSASGNSLVRLYDTPGVVNALFEVTRPSMVQAQPVVALIRYVRSTNVLGYKLTNSAIASINTAPSQLIQYTTADTNPWFSPLDFGTGPSTSREANFGDMASLNAVLSVKRALSLDEVNAVGSMWARTYGFSWVDLVSF